MRSDEANVATAHVPHTHRLRWAALLAVLAVTVLTVALISVLIAGRGSVGPGLGSSHPSAASPREGPPPWMRVEPLLAGMWLHWREYEYYDDPQSPDPANGKLLMADSWEHIGPDNVPTLFHTTITFAESGQFY